MNDNNSAFTVTASIGASGYATTITAGGHAVTADEPQTSGGENRGPDPYALLLSSLAACKLMTLRMYADRKDWPLTGASVRLRHGRVHAKDCAECETETGKVDRIDVELSLAGDLDDEQRQRLAEIADRCPVHRTLTSETVIETKLDGDAP